MTHQLNTIQELWSDFELALIAKNIDAAQRLELRKAFFLGIAGFMSLADVLIERLDAGTLSEVAFEAIHESLNTEIVQFSNALRAKRGDLVLVSVTTEVKQ